METQRVGRTKRGKPACRAGEVLPVMGSDRAFPGMSRSPSSTSQIPSAWCRQKEYSGW